MSHQCREVQPGRAFLESLYRSEELLDRCHWLQPDPGSCRTVYAALHRLQSKDSNSSENMAFGHLRFGHIVSKPLG